MRGGFFTKVAALAHGAPAQRERKRCELTGFFHHHVTSISRGVGNIFLRQAQRDCLKKVHIIYLWSLVHNYL